LDKYLPHGSLQRSCEEYIQNSDINLIVLEFNHDCTKPNQAYYRSINGVLIVFDISNPDSFKNCTKWLAEIDKFTDESVQIIIAAHKCDLGFARMNNGTTLTPPKWIIHWPQDDVDSQNSAFFHRDQLGVIAKYLDFESCLHLRLTCKLTFNLLHDRMEFVRSSFNQPHDSQQNVTREQLQEFCDKTNVQFVATSAKSGQGVRDVFRQLAAQVIDKHNETSKT